MKREEILNNLKLHKPIVVNYGKGIITNEEVKEIATYDEKIQKYRSETGIWSNRLLMDILDNKVENVKIEIKE